MFRFSTLTIFALAVGFVAAQTTTSGTSAAGTSSAATPSGSPSACIANCSTTTPGCAQTDVNCVCTNTTYQAGVAACIQSACPAELEAAQALQQAICGAVTPSGSGSGSAAPSSAAPSSGASSAAPSSGAATSKPTTSASANATKSSAPASTTATGAAFKNAPVGGAMGALAALIGAAVF